MAADISDHLCEMDDLTRILEAANAALLASKTFLVFHNISATAGKPRTGLSRQLMVVARLGRFPSEGGP
jgi:hypothetical protein